MNTDPSRREKQRKETIKMKSNPHASKLKLDRGTNGKAVHGTPGTTSHASRSKDFKLKPEQLRQIYDLMAKSRALEERLIKMYKQSDGYFWIGGPGEEAFNVPLGLLGKKGQGKDFDYWHFHYRSSATMVALGMEPVEALRQMKNVASDPFSGGRNFSNHYSRHAWNVIPVTSTIETQYATAIGTGIAQKRHGGNGITIVTGGDAGTAEGEFASCLIWSTRPEKELPMLIIVTNNTWGISTAFGTQHGEQHIADRGKAFGMKTMVVNGLDVEESYFGLKEAMDYIRKERKPVLLEAKVSRLYGHSSASGANFHSEESDPLKVFQDQLENAGVMKRAEMTEILKQYEDLFLEQAKQVKEEPLPDGSTIYDYTYYGQKGRTW